MTSLRLEDGLAELIDHRGKTPRKLGAEFADGGVPVVSAILVDGGRLNLDEARCVTDETFQRWMPVRLRQGDVLLTSEAPLGRVARVPTDAPLVLGQRLFGLRGREGVLDSGYLYYALQTHRVQAELTGRATGTTVLGIRQSALRDVRIPAPEFTQQLAIAEILGALDDKIEANRKLAATADDLSRLKFKAMQTVSGSGLVPLSDTARFVNGRAFTKDATGTGRVVIRIAELNSGLSGSTVRNDLDVHEDHLARPGDLLFAWSGSLTLARWFRGEAIVNQHIFKVIPGDGYPLWLVRQLVEDKLREFQAIAADKATTMGHIQRRHLDEPVRVPPAPAIEAADEAMDALWRRALVAEMESERLIILRNTLLPKLMSGQLRVREAELLVANAV